LSAGYSGRFGSGVISEERPHFGRRNDGGQHGREGNAVSYLGQSSCAENFNSGKSKARRTSKDYPPDPFHFVITAIALESIPLKRACKPSISSVVPRWPLTNTFSLEGFIADSSLIETQFS
jgi:hypothetical protein